MFIKTRTEQEHADSGSPGGAPAADTSTPASPAPGDVAALIADQLKSLGPALAKEVNDAVFANLRKAGVLGGKAPKTETEPPAKPAANGTSTSMSRERAFSRASARMPLTDTQFARMEKAFELEQPEDPATWVKQYVTDLGIGSDSGGQETKPKAPARTGPPASDHGAPGPVVTPSDEVDPLTFTEDDIKSFTRKEGRAAANHRLRNQFWRSLEGRRIRLR